MINKVRNAIILPLLFFSAVTDSKMSLAPPAKLSFPIGPDERYFLYSI